MKDKPQPRVSLFVTPPTETRRDTVGERRSAAHRNDPLLRWQHQVREHDSRHEVAASGAPQRLRARLVEPRTAEQCHVRTKRRSADEA